MSTRRQKKSRSRLAAHPDAPLVSLRRVSRFYRSDRPALFDVTFDLYPGEFVYVAGLSGAGKSTMLRLLQLDERPDTGQIRFLGHEVNRLNRRAISLLKRSMGIVFQDFRLVPELSVAANVGLPLEVAGASWRVIGRRVDEILERVGMGGRGGETVSGLSGGEQQRIAVARALVSGPELILADEPTGSLDSYSADFVLQLLEEAAADGAAVVLATHDRMLMAARPHRYLALERGRIVGISSPESPPRMDDGPTAAAHAG